MRPQDHGTNFAGVATAFTALGDHKVQPGLLVGHGLLDPATQCTDQAAAVLHHFYLVGGRRAKRVRYHATAGSGESLFQQGCGGGIGPTHQAHGFGAIGPLGYTRIGQQLLSKVQMLLGYQNMSPGYGLAHLLDVAAVGQ